MDQCNAIAARHPERSEGPRPGMARARGSRSLAPLGTTARALLLAGVLPLLAGLAAPLAAQVGHRPESSPYRDIRKGHTVTPFFGQFGGSGGRFAIGPHDGPIYGLRYDLRTGSTIQIGLAFARADLERLIVDPFDSLSRRVSGPVDETVTFAEA